MSKTMLALNAGSSSIKFGLFDMTGASPASTGDDGVQNQRILDAAFRSWHSGCRERIR